MGVERVSGNGDDSTSCESGASSSEARSCLARPAEQEARRVARGRHAQQRSEEVRLGQALVDAMHAWAPVDGVVDDAYLQRMAELGVLDAMADEQEDLENARREVIENASQREREQRPADPPDVDELAAEAKSGSP